MPTNILILHWYIGGFINPLLYNLALHTTSVVSVNLLRKWCVIQFNVDSNRQIWEIFQNNFFVLSEFLLELFTRFEIPELGFETWVLI